MSAEFHDESEFFAAWTSAVKLSGPGFFGSRNPVPARSIWERIMGQREPITALERDVTEHR
nr:hypothetical protein ICEMyc226_00196 [Mycolicibacterium sp.]